VVVVDEVAVVVGEVVGVVTAVQSTKEPSSYAVIIALMLAASAEH
jgi:hypothetical protein